MNTSKGTEKERTGDHRPLLFISRLAFQKRKTPRAIPKAAININKNKPLMLALKAT
jgi:hypothetical protein